MKNLIFLIAFVWTQMSLAQDLSFSQFLLMDAHVNSASVGNFPEFYRVQSIYKNQWGSVSNPFRSYAFSAELKLKGQKNSSRNYFALGAVGLMDQAGVTNFKSSIYKLASAYHLRSGRYNYLSFGLEVSYNQRSIDFNGLAWDSQFNGAGYDPSLPTLENFNSPRTGNLDFGMGFEFRNENPRELAWKAGLAAHHYYQNQDLLALSKDLLPTLIQAYWQGQNTNGQIRNRYYTYFLSQNILGAYSATLGYDISYRFNQDSQYTNFSKSSALTAGLFYRYRDALIAIIGFEYQRKFRIGIAYDINISSLRVSSGFNGGPEISLTYLGSYSSPKRRLK